MYPIDVDSDLLDGLARVESEPVGLGGTDLEGLVGLATDRDRDGLAGIGREARPEVVELVELALETERLRLGPGASEQVDELRGAGVAPSLRFVVALLALLGVEAAGDEVHNRASLRQLVECRQLLGGDERERVVWAQGDDWLESLGELAGSRGDDERIGGRRAVAVERVVEARLLEGSDVGAIER